MQKTKRDLQIEQDMLQIEEMEDTQQSDFNDEDCFSPCDTYQGPTRNASKDTRWETHPGWPGWIF